MKFTVKLSLFAIVITFTTIAATGILSYFSHIDTIEKQLHRDLQQTNSLATKTLNFMFKDIMQNLQMMACDPILISRESSFEEVQARIFQYCNIYDNYADFAYYREDDVLVTTPNSKIIVEQDWQQKFSTHDILFELKNSEETFMEFSVALYTSEKLLAIIKVRISMKEIYEKIREFEVYREQEKFYIDLVDDDGLLLYSNHNRKDILNQFFESRGTIEQQMVYKHDNYLFIMGSEIYDLEMQGLNWKFVCRIPIKASYAPINKHALVVLLPVALFFILASYFLARRMSRPIIALEKATLRLQQGQFSPVEVKGQDELANLAQAFNEMLQMRKQTEQDLRDSHEQLEQRVEERTKALKQQKNMLQIIVESIAEGLVVCDQQGNFLIFNSSAEKIVGIGAEDIPYDDWNQVYGIFYSDRKTLVPTEKLPLIQAIQGKEVNKFELFIRNPKIPEGVFISVTARPLKNELQGAVAVFRDITKEKLLEQEREQHARELERSNQELEDFAYIASHDLKEPLRGINHYASSLLKKYTETLGDDGVYRLEKLQFLAKRLENFINSLLHYSRVGRTDLAFAETNLQQILTNVFTNTFCLYSGTKC